MHVNQLVRTRRIAGRLPDGHPDVSGQSVTPEQEKGRASSIWKRRMWKKQYLLSLQFGREDAESGGSNPTSHLRSTGTKPSKSTNRPLDETGTVVWLLRLCLDWPV